MIKINFSRFQFVNEKKYDLFELEKIYVKKQCVV